MKREAVTIMVLLLLGIIVLVVAIVWGSKLPGFNLPGYYTEKDRFIRYLSCAYALCAKGCGSTEAIRPLEIDKIGNTILSCDQVCKNMGGGTRDNPVHMCGEQYALEFEFKDNVSYYSNYWDGGYSIQSDVKDKWQDIQNNELCFRKVATLKKKVWVDVTSTKLDGLYQVTPYKSGNKVTLGLDPGCQYPQYNIPHVLVGVCEGILRGYTNCKRGDTLDDTSYHGGSGTGHLWIDYTIKDQCENFEAIEETTIGGSTTGTEYYASCNFNNAQKTYIWSEADKQYNDLTGITTYCPELIICSSESPCIPFKSSELAEQLADDASASSLISFNNKFHLFYQYADDIYYKICDANCDLQSSWSAAQKITDSQHKYATPSVVEYKSKLYIAYSAEVSHPFIGSGWEVMLKSSNDGVNWNDVTGTNFVANGQITSDSNEDKNPSLAVHQDKLYIFWEKIEAFLNHHVRYAAFDGSNLVTGQDINVDSRNRFECHAEHPSAVAYNNKLYVAYFCGNGLYMKTSTDGASWPDLQNSQRITNWYDYNPSLHVYNGKLYLFYDSLVSGSANRNINYKVSLDGTTWKGCDINPQLSGTAPSFANNRTNTFLTYDSEQNINLISD